MVKPPSDLDDDFELDDEEWDELVDLERKGRPRLKHELRRKDRHDRSEEPHGLTERGTVVSLQKKRCHAAIEAAIVSCWLPAEIAARQRSAIAVGDEVVIERKGEDRVIQSVLPRRTTLSRPDPFSPEEERVVAANVDVVVQVSAAKHPPLRLGLIDRYLVAIERGGAQPALCVTKIDLVEPGERISLEASLSEYRDLGIPIVYCSIRTGQGIEDLRQLVSGRTAVLVGHSGVGKSSLLNALDDRLQLATGALHKEGSAGRHTTSRSNLFEFADGTRLIDTPGIREFGLWEMDPRSLGSYFPELAEYSTDCRFRDCTHLHEPDCAVRDAAERGEIPRFSRYVRLAEELRS